MSEAMQWLNNGLAVVIVIAGGFGLWRALSWTGTNVVLPMKDAAVDHLDRAGQAMEKNAAATRELCGTMQSIHDDVVIIKNQRCECRFEPQHFDPHRFDQCAKAKAEATSQSDRSPRG